MIRSVAVALSIVSAYFGAAPATAASLPPPWLPNDPGTAHCVVNAESARLFDDAVAISLTARDSVLQPDAFENRFTGSTLPLKGEFFTVTMRADKSKRLASQFRLEGALSCRPVTATAAAARAADRRAGQPTVLTLQPFEVRVWELSPADVPRR